MKASIVWGVGGALLVAAVGCADGFEEEGATSTDLEEGEESAQATLAALQSAFRPIRNTGNGLCLQPDPADPRGMFAAIVQRPCDYGNLAQLWKEDRIGGGRYMFVNQLSGLCTNAFDGAYNGGRVLQTNCKRISNEEFNTGVDLPNVTFIEARVGFRNTGFCVDVPGASSQVGLPVQLYQCNGTPAQRWVIGFQL